MARRRRPLCPAGNDWNAPLERRVWLRGRWSSLMPALRVLDRINVLRARLLTSPRLICARSR